MLEYIPEELRSPVVSVFEIPDAGFEAEDAARTAWNGNPAGGWRMIYTDEWQKPSFSGPVEDKPHSGNRCFRITINRNKIWARLASGSFRINPGSDVTLRIWLRADSNAREATVYLKDSTPGGPASQAIWQRRVSLDRQWRCYELKARLTARTTHLMAGVQALDGSLWTDDFSITEDNRAELPW